MPKEPWEIESGQSRGFEGEGGENITPETPPPTYPKPTAAPAPPDVDPYEPDIPSWEQRAADQAQKEYDFEAYKARQDAITRRTENTAENVKSVERFFAEAYRNNQKVDKFGWTGGSKMDADTRVKYLQASIQADMYQRDKFITSEFENNLSIAREYAALKQFEIANEYFDKAADRAALLSQTFGVHIDPVMTDMFDNYKIAMQEGDERLMASIEGAFIQMGFGVQHTDAEGNPLFYNDGTPQMVVDPRVMRAGMGFIETLHEREIVMEERMAEDSWLISKMHYIDQRQDAFSLRDNEIDHGREITTLDGEKYYWSHESKRFISEDEWDEYENKELPGKDDDDDVEPTAPSVANTHLDELLNNAKLGFFNEEMTRRDRTRIINIWQKSEFYKNSEFRSSAEQGNITSIVQSNTKIGAGDLNATYTVTYTDGEGEEKTVSLTGAELLVASLALDNNFGRANELSNIDLGTIAGPANTAVATLFRPTGKLIWGAGYSIPINGPSQD